MAGTISLQKLSVALTGSLLTPPATRRHTLLSSNTLYTMPCPQVRKTQCGNMNELSQWVQCASACMSDTSADAHLQTGRLQLCKLAELAW